MPHKVMNTLEVDETGNFFYADTPPAQTPESKFFGSPTKGSHPWTSKQDEAPGSSSTLKPFRTRQRQSNQRSKKSFLDMNYDDGLEDDDRDDDMRLPQTAATLSLAPFNETENSDGSSPSKLVAVKGGEEDTSFPRLPRSSQNALFSASADDEDQDIVPDGDKSPTPKPSRLASSRQRGMSDTSDTPAQISTERVSSSRQRKMSDASTIEKYPKKKGLLSFSSAPPSVNDSIDEESLQEISDDKRGRPAIACEMKEQAKKSADRRKSATKSNTKVKLSALDLENDEEVGERSNDPFDQINIPPSRGVSPGPSKHKTKHGLKKQSSRTSPPMRKPSPGDKKAVAKPSRRSPPVKQTVRPRQKAKPSAFEISHQLAPPSRGETDENDGCSPDEPDRPIADEFKTNEASSEAASLTQTAEAFRDCSHPAPQSEVVYVSSATDSEGFDSDESDDDDYVEKPGFRLVESIKEPPRTRNATSRPRARNGVDATSEKTRPTGRYKIEDTEKDDDVNELASKPFPQKSIKTAAAQAPVQETEVAVKSQPKKPTIHERQPAQKDQDRIEKAEENSNYKSPLRQSNQPTATNQPQVIGQDTNGHPTDPASADNSSNEIQAQRIRFTRQSRKNQSQRKPGPSKSWATQDKGQVKSTGAVLDPRPKMAQDERNVSAVSVHNKERIEKPTALGADGPRMNAESVKKPTATGHQSKTRSSGLSPESSSKNAAETEHKIAGENDRVQRKDQLEVTSASKELHAHNPRISQNHTSVVSHMPPTIPEEVEDQTHPPQPGALDAKDPAEAQEKAGGNMPQGNKYPDADEMTGSQLGGEPVENIDGQLIPDSLERPDDDADLASVSQLRDAAFISHLLSQSIQGGGSGQKRPHLDLCATQLVLPINKRYSFEGPIDSEPPAFRPQAEQTMTNDHQSHQDAFNQQPWIEVKHAGEMLDGQPLMYQQHDISQRNVMGTKQQAVDQHSKNNQQPTRNQQRVRIKTPHMDHLPKITDQPTWKRYPRMSQQATIVKPPMNNEKEEFEQLTMNLQASTDREVDTDDLPKPESSSQPGISKDSARLYSQIASTNFHRPSKRAKLDVPRLDVEAPWTISSNQFCVPMNGFSSDDVFAPKKSIEEAEVDHGVVNQLRGIAPVNFPDATALESKRPMVGNSENSHELPRQRLGTRGYVKASYPHPMQRIGPGTSQDEISEQSSGSDLGMQSMKDRRAQGSFPNMKHTEQEAVKSPDPYKAVEDVMHQIVAGALRVLHSKESEVHRVVDDYGAGGGKIVLSIAAAHTDERKQLVEEHETSRQDYIGIFEDARSQIVAIGVALQSIDFSRINAHKAGNMTLDRMKRLQQSHSLE